MSLDIAHLQGWIGRQEVLRDTATLFPVAALSATLDRTATPVTVSLVEPRSDAEYGPDSRIASYRVQHWQKGQWSDLVGGKNPAFFQLHQFPRITAERVRVTVEGSGKPPGITEFGIYDEPIG